MNKQLIALTSITAILIANSAKAFAQNGAILISSRPENCVASYRQVKPSSTKRTVVFSQFGIKMQIPENYRTLRRKDGDVWIVNPSDYDLIACVARGGQGGQGLYYGFIRNVPNVNRSTLRKYILSRYGDVSTVRPYSFSGLTGSLVQTQSEGGAAFFVEIPGIQGIVEIGASCDCTVTAEDIREILKNTSLL
jgi:hypothetical protein